MSVIFFSVTRFTPADVAAFNEVALPRLADGRWAAISRSSGGWGDRMAVTLPGQPLPSFTLERDRRGAYALCFHDRGGTVLLATGDDAAACLWIWTRTPRRAKSRRAA